MEALQQQIGRVNSWLLIVLAFVVPLSTSALTVMALLVFVCWLLEGQFSRKWEEIHSSPICWAVFFYLWVMLAGLFWTDSLPAGWNAITTQWKLWLVPVFLTTVRRELRWWYLAAFIAGLAVVMLLIDLAWLDLFASLGVDTQRLTSLLTNHIVFTPMLAFAMYLLLHQVLWGGTSGLKRWLLLALAGLMFFTVFITIGRAGQLVLFLLMALLLFQYFQRNLLKAALIAFILLPLIFSIAYRFSPIFQERLDLVRLEIETFDKNPDTPVGQRLVFWKNSWEIIRQAPWLGVGTGGFTAVYAQVNRQRSPAMPSADNPHNQYIFAAVQQGMLGLIGLLGLFLVQIYQALRTPDEWGRIRLAFPLFFMAIMTTDSYLNTYSSGFLFSLFSAVLGKDLTFGQARSQRVPHRGIQGRYWLILSYRVNIPGAACAQHIDDRLSLLEQAGITPILLTGTVGGRSDRYLHYRTWSLAPSGIRFELRHYLRNHLPRRWQFKVVETVLLIPILPLYLLEKAVINLESEWSWFAGAAVRGFFLQRRYQPEVLYSTGGSASAHIAALFLRKFSSAQWIAETQDPLVHDHEWQRSQRVFRLYRWLENRMARRCSAFVFLTQQALENARKRVGRDFPGVAIYPGAVIPQTKPHYSKGALCHFAHFGTLAGSRNLLVFFQALHLLLRECPEEGQRVRVDIYGSFDTASKNMMHDLQLESFVTFYGLIDRQRALRAMGEADCLLLIQNLSFFSTETIPSKVYEYFFCGRPILGLIHQNRELAAMLRAQSHFVAQADNPSKVSDALKEILALHATTPFARGENGTPPLYTTDRAVHQLLALTAAERVEALPAAQAAV